MEIMVVLFVLVLLVALPGRGLYWKMKKITLQDRKDQVEDALKHLYDCEYRKIDCTLMSVAGNLNLTTKSAAEIVDKLEEMGLLILKDNILLLTAEGRSYALKVIRIHRLLEKYIAEEEGLEERYWHAEAENREHTITVKEAEEMAAKLGNPVFDPHGDPIPTASGEIPAKSGRPLSQLGNGEYAQITHIEDEPEAIYVQLAAMGLYPGKHVKMIEQDNRRIRFEAGGEECILAPVLADNITVAELKPTEPVVQKYVTLDKMKRGEKARVVGISRALRGQQRRRLMDLGVIPGTVIRYLMPSPGGEPVAYEIMGTKIALRTQQSKQIFIEAE